MLTHARARSRQQRRAVATHRPPPAGRVVRRAAEATGVVLMLSGMRALGCGTRLSLCAADSRDGAPEFKSLAHSKWSDSDMQSGRSLARSLCIC